MNIRFVIVSAVVVVCSLFFSVGLRSYSHAQDNPADVVVFVREGCAHCKEEEQFLGKLAKESPLVRVEYYRLENPDHRAVWSALANRLGIPKVTPITVIGDTYLVGFGSENTTGKTIRNLIRHAQQDGIMTDIHAALTPAGQQGSACPEDGSQPCLDESASSFVLTLPLVGSINAQAYPLAALSALLGFFDGFNPCAMWVLVTFLVILLQVGSRRKMLVFAGTFILAEALMYALILTVWFKTWDFVQLNQIVTPAVGAVSVAGGIVFLREWRKKELECRVTSVASRAKTHKRIKALAAGRFTVFTFLGILGVAFSVNIIEFACSVGIPQAFTKILELNNLPALQSTFLIFVYILFYMLDDLLVFGLALYGADKLSLTAKYSKWSNLAGGVVMIVLGSVLLLRPDLLLF